MGATVETLWVWVGDLAIWLKLFIIMFTVHETVFLMSPPVDFAISCMKCSNTFVNAKNMI